MSALSAIKPKSISQTSGIAHTVPAGFSYKSVRKIYVFLIAHQMQLRRLGPTNEFTCKMVANALYFFKVTENQAKPKKMSTELETGTKYLSEDLALREILLQIGHWLTPELRNLRGLGRLLTKDLVNVWRPDRFSKIPRLRRKAQKKLKEINEAYERLQSYLSDLEQLKREAAAQIRAYGDSISRDITDAPWDREGRNSVYGARTSSPRTPSTGYCR